VGGPIILISIDTLRADRLPLYGYRNGRTPRIDKFAREAVVFEHAYAHAPQTLPSHASILTGQLPFEHGVRDNIGFTIPSSARMLQHDLRDAGYATAGVVSAFVLRQQTGIASGFDFFNSQLPPAAADRSLGQVQRDGMDSLAVVKRWLDGHTDPRFFLFFHIYEPHKPYAPPARWATVPSGDPYDGEVSYSDEIVGALLDDLERRKLYYNATIVLLADHGEGLGDHVEQEHGLFLYDETIRVPLVIKLPESAHGGRRVGLPVQHIDLRPTLDEIAGARVSGLRGRSLLPLLNETGSIRPEGIYSEAMYSRYHFGWSELLSLTDDRYRYIKAPREELYDLARDPREKQNIAPERSQVAVAMGGALRAISGSATIHKPSEVSAEDRQRLQALGYIGSQAAADERPGEQLPDPKDKAQVLEDYRLATELAGRLKLRESEAIFQKLVKEDPNMTDVWAQYGQVLSMLGNTEGALHAYKEILKRNPTDTGSLIAAASALQQLKRYDEAKAHADLAVARSPAPAHEMLARIAIARGDADAARREARLAHQADPTLPMPDYVEGLLAYNAGRYAEAAAAFERAAGQERARTLQLNELEYYLGDSLARLERYAEAEPHFRREIALYPFNARARAGLAMLYRAQGRDQESAAAIDEMLEVSPTPEAYNLAAQLWTMFGEPARAAAVREQAKRR
jgi:tetratricopeptide (TPR) repeat protein